MVGSALGIRATATRPGTSALGANRSPRQRGRRIEPSAWFVACSNCWWPAVWLVQQSVTRLPAYWAMHRSDEAGQPDCSPIGTTFVSRPRQVADLATTASLRIGWDPMGDGPSQPGGDITNTTRDDRRAPACQFAMPNRGRNATWHWHETTATTRSGSPGQAAMIELLEPMSASSGQLRVNRIGAGVVRCPRAGSGGFPRRPESEGCYPRRTPQNSGNIDFTMFLMSERNAVG